MKQVSIIFPNQLFRESPILKINCEVLILEDSLFFGNDKFHKLINHKNKLVFHRASMLAYKNYLEISLEIFETSIPGPKRRVKLL